MHTRDVTAVLSCLSAGLKKPNSILLGDNALSYALGGIWTISGYRRSEYRRSDKRRSAEHSFPFYKIFLANITQTWQWEWVQYSLHFTTHNAQKDSIDRQFSFRSRSNLGLIIPNNKTLEH